MAEKYNAEQLLELTRVAREKKAKEKEAKAERAARGACLYQGEEVPIQTCKSLAGKAGFLSAPADALLRGRETNHKRKLERCEAIVPDIPLKPEPSIWNCPGGCGFDCMRNVVSRNFVGVSNVLMANFLIRHHAIKPICDNSDCKYPVAARSTSPNDYEIYCTHCYKICKSSKSGILSGNKLALVKRVALCWHIVNGSRYKDVKRDFHVGKNTFSLFARFVERVCRFRNSENRRPCNKFDNCQIDETAISSRKHHRGKRQKKIGTLWALTILKVSEPDESGKIRSLYVDIQFIRTNKRTIASLYNPIKKRVKRGGKIYTDGWASYPRIAKILGCQHFVVNHKHFFKDPKTGIHTNNVEGIHKHLKMDSSNQFGRCADINKLNKVRYLDLAMWRVNASLAVNAGDVDKKDLWRSWCLAAKDMRYSA